MTPYTDDVQLRIGKVWASEGIACHAERHLGLRDNFSFGETTPAEIADMIRAVAAEGCDAIVVLCTNMDGAAVTEAQEGELNVLILVRSQSRCGERCCSPVQTREYYQIGDGSFSPDCPRSDRRHFAWHSLTSPSAAAPS